MHEGLMEPDHGSERVEPCVDSGVHLPHINRRANLQNRFLRLVQYQREKDQREGKTQFEILEREPSESLVIKELLFSQDERMRDIYVTANQGLRIGRILEDLDALAGEIAYKHAEGFSTLRPVAIVTASCDRIQLIRPLVSSKDIKMIGWVTWVGTSSMEVRIEVKQSKSQNASEPIYDVCAVAYFVMVARDVNKGVAATVHKIKPVTEQDHKFFEMGNKSQMRRKSMAERSLHRIPPNEEELLLIHNIFINLQSIKNGAASDGEYLFINKTTMTSTKIMHPQQRNIHNKIFGGYLLREACDVAWATVFVFSQQEPVFTSVDDNHFIKPVDVGSVVNFIAKVVYTENDTCIVRVDVQDIDPVTGKNNTTNVFHFGFHAELKKRRVVPETYEEAMLYIAGRRIYEKGSHKGTEDNDFV